MSQTLLHIRRALISVSNKSNILKLAHVLSKYNIELLASEITAKKLAQSGLKVTTISQYTNFPEIMNGRIKTLHTKIYAGILARPHIDSDIMKKYSIKPIHMVIVNFYPYTSASKKEIFENNKNNTNIITEKIDIGGPNIVRAAAKNYQNVVVITSNSDYTDIINELKKNKGKISIHTRLKLATKAFQYVTTYDTLISDSYKKQLIKNKYHNNKQSNIHFPDYITCLNTNFIKKEKMRYGENPHQSAIFYTNSQNLQRGSISSAEQLQGKKLSFNNILDLDTALECVKMFTKPTCIIIKHGNPCGAATNDTILAAYKKAYQTDPTSAFGGIIAFNKILDTRTAKTIIEQQFTEAIIAPFIEENALKIFKNKKNIRILTCGTWKKINTTLNNNLDFKQVNGGLLIQNKNIKIIDNLTVVTKRQPNDKEMENALFCWKIVKFVKSNAIVYGRDKQTIGIGSGQSSRIDAAKIANLKAKNQGFHLKNATMASDAFLPFPDTIELAGKIGITCIIQPGGGINNEQIISTADEYNISMIFTNMRHFKH